MSKYFKVSKNIFWVGLQVWYFLERGTVSKVVGRLIVLYFFGRSCDAHKNNDFLISFWWNLNKIKGLVQTLLDCWIFWSSVSLEGMHGYSSWRYSSSKGNIWDCYLCLVVLVQACSAMPDLMRMNWLSCGTLQIIFSSSLASGM